ncbi:hypothetical protein [Leifsonia poae]|uniref:hypothetical protein n=1 Tax=Leifsonia poae TaxID=110933 RepID=UPI001CBD1ABA|nr:hypothetical protein [Leifsonia poae]
MYVSPLALLSGVGTVVLALVAFTVAFTWPVLASAIQRMRSERSRLAAFAGLGGALVLASVPLYLVPGILLRDELGFALLVLVAATWVIASVSLVVRAMLVTGVARVITTSYAIVAGSGLIAGLVSAVCSQHRIADTITPTGAFLLGLAAVTGIVFWSKSDSTRMSRA